MLARLAVLVLALFVLVAQVVPWWLAERLSLDRVSVSPESATGSPRADIDDDHRPTDQMERP